MALIFIVKMVIFIERIRNQKVDIISDLVSVIEVVIGLSKYR